MTAFQEYATRWSAQVEALVASGYYADSGRATAFLARHVLPAWRALSEVDSNEEVMKKYGISSTQALVVHLFARGVLGVGAAEDMAPRLAVWRPTRARGVGGAPVCHRVISTGDIARIIGRSRAAVVTALRRFKGLAGVKAKYGMWNVISMPGGVAIDGFLSTATRHPYMYAGHEYADARGYARACRVRHARFTKRQRRWCEEAMVASGMRVERNVRRKEARAAEYF